MSCKLCLAIETHNRLAVTSDYAGLVQLTTEAGSVQMRTEAD